MGGNRSGLAGFYGANSGPLPFTFGRLPFQNYDVIKVFLGAQLLTQSANPGQKQPGELPDFSRFSWKSENRAVYPISPEAKEQCQAAAQLAAEGRTDEAIQRYREVLAADASNALALSSLAWFLATAGKPELRNGTEAVQLAPGRFN